jgi:hypothetical protein
MRAPCAIGPHTPHAIILDASRAPQHLRRPRCHAYAVDAKGGHFAASSAIGRDEVRIHPFAGGGNIAGRGVQGTVVRACECRFADRSVGLGDDGSGPDRDDEGRIGTRRERLQAAETHGQAA